MSLLTDGRVERTFHFDGAPYWDEEYARQIEDDEFIRGSREVQEMGLHTYYCPPGDIPTFRQNLLRGYRKYYLDHGRQSMVPLETQRLQLTVGHIGHGRYEWLQSFQTLLPYLEAEVGPRMRGWKPPPLDPNVAPPEPAPLPTPPQPPAVPGSARSRGSRGGKGKKKKKKRKKDKKNQKGQKGTTTRGGDAAGGGESKTAYTAAFDTAFAKIQSAVPTFELLAPPKPYRAHDPHRVPAHTVAPDVRVLHVGCGTSTFGEEMHAAGWPNVLNLDFSKVCVDHIKKLWEQANHEEIQRKILADLKEETDQERDMIAAWEARRAASAEASRDFAAAETTRVNNKNAKRDVQLAEFEAKCRDKIQVAQQQRTAAEAAFQDAGGDADGEGGGADQAARDARDTAVAEARAAEAAATEKLEAMRAKAAEAVAKSNADLAAAIANRDADEGARLDQLEAQEKQAHRNWQQQRRDYHTKGGGLFEGVRHFQCDTTKEEEFGTIVPDDTFDLVVDKATLDSIMCSVEEIDPLLEEALREGSAADAARKAEMEGRAGHTPLVKYAPAYEQALADKALERERMLRSGVEPTLPNEHTGEKIPFLKYGKHIRNMWRSLKPGGVYMVVSTERPERRVQKIKRVGHGLKARYPMWTDMWWTKLEKLGGHEARVVDNEDRYHYLYVFVKAARRDVKKVQIVAQPDPGPVVEEVPEEEEEESSDDSSEADLMDDEESSEEEEDSDDDDDEDGDSDVSGVSSMVSGVTEGTGGGDDSDDSDAS